MPLRTLPSAISLPVLLSAMAAAGADLSGRWEGAAAIPGAAPMPIVLDLTRVAAGRWTGSTVLPGRGVKGAPLADLAVLAGGRVFAGSCDSRFYALDDRSGELLWKFSTAGERRFEARGLHGFLPLTQTCADPFDVYLSSPVVADGRVFFGSGDGKPVWQQFQQRLAVPQQLAREERRHRTPVQRRIPVLDAAGGRRRDLRRRRRGAHVRAAIGPARRYSPRMPVPPPTAPSAPSAKPAPPATPEAPASPVPQAQTAWPLRPALAVGLAGVAAALHVGKLPPAVIALQQALGLTLVEAGFLLSLVQGAGMTAGLAFGLLADRLGGRRSMLCGLALLVVASACGGLASGATGLMVWRALEGCGFLLVVLPAPGLLRRLVAPRRLSATMGLWGAYMPLATALALLLGPLCIQALGWRGWWWSLAVLSAAAAWWLAWAVPARFVDDPVATRATSGWSSRLRLTLAAPGPWLVAATFAMYSGQWLAVVGFLPTIYAQAGVAASSNGPLTALAAGVNMLGNIAAGRLLQRGVRPERLLVIGFLSMAAGATAAFAGTPGSGLSAPLRYAAVLCFSGFGGLIPATLFALALRVAPVQAALSSTVGWVQQWSALGQFAGPPLVAWIASRFGGWQFTWCATVGFCALGLVLVSRLARRLRAATPR